MLAYYKTLINALESTIESRYTNASIYELNSMLSQLASLKALYIAELESELNQYQKGA